MTKTDNGPTVFAKIENEAGHKPRYVKRSNVGNFSLPGMKHWIRHNQLVDEAVALQKVMDTVGTILQKVISPISFSSSDLVNLVSLFRKP